MSDLPYIQQAQEVKITGQGTTGATVNYVGADSNGNMTTRDASDGPVVPGTVASTSILIGGQFNTTLPTLTTSQQSALQSDSNGRIITAPMTISSPVANKAGLYAMVANGALNVQGASGTLFYDSFDSSGLDTTNRWSLTTANGGSQSQASGINTLSVTTAASSESLLLSQPSFSPSFSSIVFGVQLTTGATPPSGAHSFWGLGTTPVSFTAATPLLNAIGFEIDTTGNLNAVIYSNGTKVNSTTLNTFLSASPQIFSISITGETATFYIQSQGFELPVAGYVGFTLNSFILPLHAHIINGTSVVGTARTLPMSGMALGDTDPNNTTNISDGTFGWRKAKVDSTGNISVIEVDKSGSGTLTALNTTVVAIINGYSTIIFNTTGTWSGAIVFEGQNGDGTWTATLGFLVSSGGVTNSLTANASIVIPCGGFSQIRARMLTYVSGTATINYNASIGMQGAQVFNLTPASLTGIMNIKDSIGNSVASLNSQLQTRDVLNTTVQNRAQSVTTSAAEALGGGTILVNRKLLSITPTNGIIYWGATGVTTASGSPIFPNNTAFFDVTDNVHIFLVAGSTTDARIAEFS